MKEGVAKSKHFKNRTILSLLMFTLLFLSGCVEEVELEEKVIVSMVGIDQMDNGIYTVTMGLIDTRLIEEKEDKGVRVYSVEGESIFEAVRSSILKIGRQPQWPYIQVLVFGPAFSEADVVPVLDFFNRNNEVQPNPYITFSHELAKDIIHLDTELFNIPGVIVEDQFKLQDLVAHAPSIELHQFTEMMLSPEQVGFAAIINKEEENNKFIPKIEGTAVIKEGNWIGDLSKIETRGLLWVRGEVRGGIIVISSIEDQGRIGLEILDQSKISIDPLLKNSELTVEINVEQLVSISEVMAFLDLNEQNIEEIKRETEKQIKNEIEATITKTKEWGTDIFEINRAVHRKYPKYWREHKENWGESFSALPIEIKVHVDIKTMGLMGSLPKDN